MELRHLRYFAAVAGELNFRRAAERLHVSAPTLSEQVRDLEHTLGVTLFERSTTRVRLTTAGRVFLGEVLPLLSQVERAAQAARDAAAGLRGTLRIGHFGALSHAFMPACLSAFRRLYPDVEVELSEVDFPEQVTFVEEGRTDLGFIPFPPAKLPASMASHLVLCSPLRAVMGRRNPLARHKRLHRAQLEGVPLVAVGPGRNEGHAQFITELVRAQGVEPGPIRSIDGYETLLTVIAAGREISLLPHAAGLRLPTSVTSREVRDGINLTFRLHAIWPRSGPSGLAHQFLRILRQKSPAGRSRG